MLLFVGLIAITAAATVTASLIQTNFGGVEVTNVTFVNEYGVSVRGKLFRPKAVTASRKAPGVVFIPGYASIREAGDAVAIELARRDFVVLAIDAIGRGNSGMPPRNLEATDFDKTFGGRAALGYLRSMPFVAADDVAMVGHSLGAQMAYTVGLLDPTVRATVMMGSAYDTKASPSHPANLLMVFGRYDEFRDRMTGTRHFETEWMRSKETKAAFGMADAKLWTTYGDFSAGTARRVIAPSCVHEMEPHNRTVVAETIAWLQHALLPESPEIRDTADQIWPIKEWCTLTAMIAGFASLIPLAFLLVQWGPLSSLLAHRPLTYVCPGSEALRYAAVNGLLMWLYLPAAMIVFAIHKYVVRIDDVLPMMVVNVVVLWLLLSNFIGWRLFMRWAKRHPMGLKPLLHDLGISFGREQKRFPLGELGKTIALALLLFAFAYGLQNMMERLFLVDYRFIYAFANDLTPYRWLMWALYFPLFLLGFIAMGFFLHGQLRPAPSGTAVSTFVSWSLRNLLVLASPMVLLAAVQYLPLFAVGAIPLVGPGGMFVLFLINIAHLIGVLCLIIPLSTWLYQLTGRPYAGAILNAAIVAWMYASTQVIAPVPL